jgi:hypothetical protein
MRSEEQASAIKGSKRFSSSSAAVRFIPFVSWISHVKYDVNEDEMS